MSTRDNKLHALGDRLAKFYEPGDMLVWLFTPHPLLDNLTPVALIEERRLTEICRLLEQIDHGSYT